MLHADVAARVDGAAATGGVVGVGGGRDGVVSRPQTLFEFQQLAHEVEIGRDDGSPLLHHRVGLHQRERRVSHQVGDGHRRRA